ncbi:MAG TPA: nucleoside transporter C-terminal domain-containing protein [Terriglobales bacterium]|nr:nucleoside transporter C-terminal domain-containing protein [Terriglobales bacterium]
MHFTGILGILLILGLAYAFSSSRKSVNFRIIAWGVGLQIIFAFLVIKFTYGQMAMSWAGDKVNTLLGYAQAGASFVFGSLADPTAPAGFVFAFRVLPTIIFMAAFFAVLYYLKIMQVIITAAAWVMTRIMGVSGAESLDVAASIFMGQTEAPLTIRPFLSKLTQSELMTVMTAGMAHVSGGIMAAYIANGAEAKHILGAVIMTAPGTLLIAKTLVPETEVPVSGKNITIAEADEHRDQNILSAIARGTGDGLSLAINVAAMLIAFLALIAFANGVMGWIHDVPGFGRFPSSLQQFMGWLFKPVAWLIGIPWQDAGQVGSLLGTRMIANELVAFVDLGKLKDVLDPRSFTIATYALCGFANLSSIGIQIGGIGALAPERRNDLARLGFRAMLAGTAANLISAAIVGMMI